MSSSTYLIPMLVSGALAWGLFRLGKSCSQSTKPWPVGVALPCALGFVLCLTLYLALYAGLGLARP